MQRKRKINGTEQQADGLGPPWVKVGGGAGKGLYNEQRVGPEGTTLAMNLSVLKSCKSASASKTGVWDST